MTKTQLTQLSLINASLTGNYLSPSKFLSCTIEKTDPFTKSILVTLNFENHYGTIWVGTKGGVRDINGRNLKKAGKFCYLPRLKGC